MAEYLAKWREFQQKVRAAAGNNQFFNYRIVWLGVIGILLLVFSRTFGGDLLQPLPVDEAEIIQEPVQASTPLVVNTTANLSEQVVEEKLSQILSQVKGAGKVVVGITFTGSTIKEHAKNIQKETKIVQEKDPSGGVRTTTESKTGEQILMSKAQGADQPVMVTETRPEVKGVLIVAEGAANSTVKANLTQAAAIGLGIASYKITVLPQGK